MFVPSSIVFLTVLLLTFLESSTVPFLPLEAILVPAVASGKLAASHVFLAGLAGSTAGSVFGGYIGIKFESVLPTRYREKVEEVEKFVQDYKEVAVFVAALTPIPYTITTIASGMLGIKISRLLVVSLLGRGSRVALVVFGTDYLLGLKPLMAGLLLSTIVIGAYTVWIVLKNRVSAGVLG